MNNTNTIVHPGVYCKTTAVTLRPGTRQFEGMCYVRLGIIMLYLNICKQSRTTNGKIIICSYILQA